MYTKDLLRQNRKSITGGTENRTPRPRAPDAPPQQASETSKRTNIKQTGYTDKQTNVPPRRNGQQDGANGHGIQIPCFLQKFKKENVPFTDQKCGHILLSMATKNDIRISLHLIWKTLSNRSPPRSTQVLQARFQVTVWEQPPRTNGKMIRQRSQPKESSPLPL